MFSISLERHQQPLDVQEAECLYGNFSNKNAVLMGERVNSSSAVAIATGEPTRVAVSLKSSLLSITVGIQLLS